MAKSDTKIIITGPHASGKNELITLLSNKLKLNIGRLFSNDPLFEYFTEKDGLAKEYMSNDDVRLVFENNACLFCSNYTNEYFDGITRQSFDENDLFCFSLEQMINIQPKIFTNYDIIIIWLDNNKKCRKIRYDDEDRVYNFPDYERRDNHCAESFVEYVSDKQILYFVNEDIGRIYPIIKTIIKHDDMAKLFLETYKY